MGYYVGDIPAQPLVIEPALGTLEDFTRADAQLTSPDGLVVTTLDADIDVDNNQVVVDWPEGDSVLLQTGPYELRVTLSNDTGATQRWPLVLVIVQDDSDGWHSLDSVRDVWPDAPDSDRWCYELLEVAKNDILVYRPDVVTAIPPASRRRAQQMHARDIWTATEVQASGDLGDGSFSIQPHPLDWMVKQIVRPRRAIGATA